MRTASPSRPPLPTALPLLLLLLSLPACSPRGALFLTIEAQREQAPLKVPDDVDELALQVTSTDGARVVFDKAYPLSTEAFPLSVALEAGSQTPSEIRVVATLSKGGAPVAGAEATATLEDRKVTNVTLRVTSD